MHAGRFHIILSQRPDATQVMGYRGWQLWRRTVRRGEKGIRILVPVRAGDRQEPNDDPDDEPEQRRSLFFRTASVFDVSQTEVSRYPTLSSPS